MVTLARFDGLWYLIVSHESLGSLRVSADMPHHEGFGPLPPHGAVLSRPVDNLEGLIFYPAITFLGVSVTPSHWKTRTTEPKLVCLMAYHAVSEQRKRELETLGWTWSGEGGEGIVHVDDLEKIQGPPLP